MGKPFVIAVAGSVASGKSTVAKALSEQLNDAPVLAWDHYEEYVEWPPDMARWMQEGCDMAQVRNPRLRDDLLALLDGSCAIDPRTGIELSAGPYIVLEEPSGRERRDISRHISSVVFVDVPQDICVARMVARAMDMAVWRAKGTYAAEGREDLARLLDATATWLDHYFHVRDMYLGVSDRVRGRADLVVDGCASIETIVQQILGFIGIGENQGARSPRGR